MDTLRFWYAKDGLIAIEDMKTRHLIASINLIKRWIKGGTAGYSRKTQLGIMYNELYKRKRNLHDDHQDKQKSLDSPPF